MKSRKSTSRRRIKGMLQQCHSMIHPEARSPLRFDSIREAMDRWDRIPKSGNVLKNSFRYNIHRRPLWKTRCVDLSWYFGNATVTVNRDSSISKTFDLFLDTERIEPGWSKCMDFIALHPTTNGFQEPAALKPTPNNHPYSPYIHKVIEPMHIFSSRKCIGGREVEFNFLVPVLIFLDLIYGVFFILCVFYILFVFIFFARRRWRMNKMREYRKNVMKAMRKLWRLGGRGRVKG